MICDQDASAISLVCALRILLLKEKKTRGEGNTALPSASRAALKALVRIAAGS